MGAVSVAQAAERLGVSVPRIHQRIADGSLSAERIGSQWAVDERSLLRIQERSNGKENYNRIFFILTAVKQGFYRFGYSAYSNRDIRWNC
jgi:excisionase family DNA binding protein